jgi:hypothetical protein
MIGRLRALAVAIIAAAMVLPSAGEAVAMVQSTRPLPQRQVRTAPNAADNWRAVRTGTHRVYGVITAIGRNVIYVERRNRRIQAVNIAAAVAHGDYSSPLFVGKTVSVDGEMLRGTFVASHVFRLENLNALPADR